MLFTVKVSHRLEDTGEEHEVLLSVNQKEAKFA